MSGIAKGIGKVFKAVGGFVKKVLPVAALVGAAVFTGGAALPAIGAATGTAATAGGGGFLASLAGGSGALGAFGSTTFGQILTGAAKQAVVGGAMSAISGGSFADGAKMGALAGGFGGAMGGLGTSALTQPTATTMSTSGLPASVAGVAGAPTAVAAPTGGFLRGLFDKEMVGNLISGAAEGWAAKAAAKDAEEQIIRQENRRADRWKGSGEAMQLSNAPNDVTEEPIPTRFDEKPRKRHRYNPETKRIDFA